MQRLLRSCLAAIYITASLVVVTNQAVTAGDELEKAMKSTAWQLSSPADAHGATDPHFSHAKKTRPDFGLSMPFHVRSERDLQHAVPSDCAAFQSPRCSRAPPLFSDSGLSVEVRSKKGVGHHESRSSLDCCFLVCHCSPGAAGDPVESDKPSQLHSGAKLVSRCSQAISTRADPAAGDGEF